MTIKQIWNKFGLFICLALGLAFTTMSKTPVDMIITLLWAIGMGVWITFRIRANRRKKNEKTS